MVLCTSPHAIVITRIQAVAAPVLAACSTTTRLEPYKQTNAVIEDGDGVVILARRHHSTHEAEQDFVDCISDALAKGRDAIEVHDSPDFLDTLSAVASAWV